MARQNIDNRERGADVRNALNSNFTELYATNDVLPTTAGAGLVGSNDGSGGSLWTTVAGFISFIRSALGATIIGYRAAGVGAAIRTLWAVIADLPLNVKSFGAIGDNTTDNRIALNNAAAALHAGGGGVLYFPTGRYYSSDRFSLPTNAKIILEGDGKSASVLRFASSAAGGVRFTNNSFLVTGGGVRNLTIESGAGFESAEFFGEGSPGIGLEIIRASDGFTVEDVGINNFGTGQAMLGCFNTRSRAVAILFAKTVGLLVDREIPGDTGSVVGASNSYSDYKISNFGFSGDNSASIGVRIRASGGESLKFIDATSHKTSWRIDPRSGDWVLYLFGSQVLADGAAGNGWEIDGSGGIVASCHFYDFWASFATDHGVYLTGANVRDVQMWGRVRENGKHGILAETGRWYWRGGAIVHNGRLTAATYDGVNVAAGVSDWAVQNSLIGNDGQASPSRQRNGITVAAGASDTYSIDGNRFVANTGVPLNDGGSGSEKVIQGNLPRAVAGLNPTGAIILYASTGVSPPAAGSTWFIGAASSSSEAAAVWRASRAGVITQLQIFSSNAPGAGQTYTYTLMKNGAATGLTLTSSGVSAFGGTVSSPAVSFLLGDSISIRIETSAGATVTNHSGSLRFE